MISWVSSSPIAIYHRNCPDDHPCRCQQQCPAEMMTALTSNCWRSWQTAAAPPAMCSSHGRGFNPLLSWASTHFSWVLLITLGFYSLLRTSTHCSGVSTHFSRGFFSFILGSTHYSRILSVVYSCFSPSLLGFHSFLWGLLSNTLVFYSLLDDGLLPITFVSSTIKPLRAPVFLRFCTCQTILRSSTLKFYP